jgi:hypothetical protein
MVRRPIPASVQDYSWFWVLVAHSARHQDVTGAVIGSFTVNAHRLPPSWPLTGRTAGALIVIEAYVPSVVLSVFGPVVRIYEVWLELEAYVIS